MAKLGSDGLNAFEKQVEEAKEKIEEIEDGIPQVLDDSTEHAATVLHNEMKRNIVEQSAIDTGELIRSVEFSQKKSAQGGGAAKYSVGPTAEHAPYVEYGTDRHTITPEGVTEEQVRNASPNQKKMLANAFGSLSWAEQDADGPVLLAEHPGTSAQPYFRPAVIRAEESEWLADSIDKHTTALFTGVMG